MKEALFILPFLVLASIITITADPGSTLFSWHPTCMSASFLVLLPFSTRFLKYRTAFTYRTRKLVHWSSQLLALALCLAGFYAIYENKNRIGKPHFTTKHGLSGLVVGVLVVVQGLIFGVPANWKIGRLSMAKFKKWHIQFSGVTLLACAVCLITACDTVP